MAATVIINRLTGAGPTATDITSANTRASTSDAPTPGTSDPIPVPGTGTNFSFWVTTQLEATVTPDTAINNLQWYTDGTNSMGTGVTCVAMDASSYVQATGTQGTTGTELTTGNHAGLTGAPSDAFGFNSGAPLSVAGTLSNPTTGAFGNRVVYQIAVADTAGPGATTAETFTWSYDET